MCVLVSISVVDCGTILGWQSVDNKDSKRCKEKFKYKEVIEQHWLCHNFPS